MDKEDKQAMDSYDERLKGTFISVVAIGVFVLLTWLGMLYFYLSTI